MSPSVRHIVIEGPDQCKSLVFVVVIIAVLSICAYKSPAVTYALTGFRGFNFDEPAPCKLLSTEKWNQCPKWLATQFMRRAIDHEYRFAKQESRCWHRNRQRMINAFHQYYYTSELFTVFARYVADDMGAEKSADVMSLV